MEKNKKRMAIGMTDFVDLRRQNRYYADKTGLIRDVVWSSAQVLLYTRPRRFGKSLNMSMLAAFFEMDTDAHLFDGLQIAEDKELCAQFLGKYPVIHLELAEVSGADAAHAEQQLRGELAREADRLDGKYQLRSSDRLSPMKQRQLLQILAEESNPENGLAALSDMLYAATGCKAIVLIDEYDVPLQQAERGGYYREMADTISRFFSKGLKNSRSLAFAVVTGCLRVAHASIFSGFNNVRVNTILDETPNEWFGFTDQEVADLLQYYGCETYQDITREWYDGFRFGRQQVYCPWDVLCWVDHLLTTGERTPQNFWAHTSGNDIIHRFAELASPDTRVEMEKLLDGGTIQKHIELNLTYADLGQDIDQIWSVLLTTGYLTFSGRAEDGAYVLRIPNGEMQQLFRQEYDRWFAQRVRQDKDARHAFLTALAQGDAAGAQRILREILRLRVSLRDTQVTLQQKESYYQGMMNILFYDLPVGWEAYANAERGDGYPDFVLEQAAASRAIVLELKYAADDTLAALTKATETAFAQMQSRHYLQYYSDHGFSDIRGYAIAFHGKHCRVALMP